MTSRVCIAAVLGLALASPPSANAQALTNAEAVAVLMFSPQTTSFPKTLGARRVLFQGAGRDRIILSVAESRAAPCLFEVLFVDAPPPGPPGSPNVPAASGYAASIDLRKLSEATFRPASSAGDGRLVLRAKVFYCARIFTLEEKLGYSENCLDAVDDAVTPENTPRLSAAFETLKRACGW